MLKRFSEENPSSRKQNTNMYFLLLLTFLNEVLASTMLSTKKPIAAELQSHPDRPALSKHAREDLKTCIGYRTEIKITRLFCLCAYTTPAGRRSYTRGEQSQFYNCEKKGKVQGNSAPRMAAQQETTRTVGVNASPLQRFPVPTLHSRGMQQEPFPTTLTYERTVRHGAEGPPV